MSQQTSRHTRILNLAEVGQLVHTAVHQRALCIYRKPDDAPHTIAMWWLKDVLFIATRRPNGYWVVVFNLVYYPQFI